MTHPSNAPPPDDLDDILSRLRVMLTEPTPDASAVDIEFNLLSERLLRRLHMAERDELAARWRRVRALYDRVAAGLDDDEPEGDPRFRLGRLASLVEIAAAAVQRTPPAELRATLNEARHRRILALLRDAPSRASRDLAAATGESEALISKDLGKLQRLRLIVSRKDGRQRVSHITLLGREALADAERRHATAQPAEPTSATAD